MSSRTIIKRNERGPRYLYVVHSTHHGLARNDCFYDRLLPALIGYLRFATEDPFHCDYIELERRDR